MLAKRIERMIDVIQSMIDEEKERNESNSTGIKGVNRSFRLTNKDDEQFLFKPQSGEHTSRWRYVPPKSQYKRERAAYLVSLALGWDMVPLTKIISHNDEIGSLQSWVKGATKPDKTLNTYSMPSIWKAGLFDIIIGNSDRHAFNWLTLESKPILIDNGYSFPFKAEINDPRSAIVSRFSFRIWKKKIPKVFYDDLINLKEIEIQEHLRSLVDLDAFKLFNERLKELQDTGIAEVSKYVCIEKVIKDSRGQLV